MLMVALDVPTVLKAQTFVDLFGDDVEYYKIGTELIYDERGVDFIRFLKNRKKKVFVDAKLHDISRTVEATVTKIARLEADFVSVHAIPSAVKSAWGAAKAFPNLKIIAVTELTDQEHTRGTKRKIEQYATQAIHQGADGLVVSGLEVEAIRKLVGPTKLLFCPGIRSRPLNKDDQKRVSTPAEAMAAGANYIIMGRPIILSKEPRIEIQNINKEIKR